MNYQQTTKPPGIFTKLKMRLLTTQDPGFKCYESNHKEEEFIHTTHFSFQDRLRILLGSDMRLRHHILIYPNMHTETKCTQMWIIREKRSRSSLHEVNG
jgi:hypothetical protein